MDQIMNQIMGMSGTEKSEYVRYATISVLSDCDKKSYNMDNALKSPKLCQECGIIYFTSISSKCPLCAMKEMFLSSNAIGTEIEKKGKSQQKAKKIGRNDLCPCGSGLKYKNCCGRNDWSGFTGEFE